MMWSCGKENGAVELFLALGKWELSFGRSAVVGGVRKGRSDHTPSGCSEEPVRIRVVRCYGKYIFVDCVMKANKRCAMRSEE
jgi:hypothetical protein